MRKGEEIRFAEQVTAALAEGLTPEETARRLNVKPEKVAKSMAGEAFREVFRAGMNARTLAAYAAAVGRVGEMLRSEDAGVLYKGVHEALTQFAGTADRLGENELRVVLVNAPDLGMPEGETE